MMKLFVFFALIAMTLANPAPVPEPKPAPGPKANPGILAYSAPLISSPYAYSAYSAPLAYSPYVAAPSIYASGYTGYSPYAYSAYNAPLVYV